MHGVYDITIDLNPEATYEYKFTLDAWTNQENFEEGSSCTSTIDGFTNRTLTTGTADETLAVVCYNSCDICSGIAPGTAVVTFNVNMANEVVAESGVYVAGGDFFGAPGTYLMTDDDNDGVYSIDIELPTPFTGAYVFTNGACGDYSCKEDLAGQECAFGTWNDRLLSDITEDTVISTCFGECSTDGSCPAPAVMVDVLFSIDMTNYAYLLDTDYSAVVVNGSWNGWGAWGVELAYNWNNGRFEGTLNLEEGTSHEFVIAATGAADGWSGWGYVIHAPYQCSPNWVLGGPTENLNYGFIATEGATVEYCAGSCEATCPILGCTDPAYAEFALAATEDDGSCVTPVVYGCIYEAADNYDAEANTDNGNCIFAEENCAGDLDGDGLIATPDLLSFLSMFGTTCGE